MSENWQPPPAQQPPPSTLAPDQERLWATLSHVLSFVAAYIAMGFLAPLVILLVFGKQSAYVKHHATESLNFQITSLIYFLISAILILVLIGIFMIIAWAIAYVVLVIVATIKASNGEWYRYPLTIRLVK